MTNKHSTYGDDHDEQEFEADCPQPDRDEQEREKKADDLPAVAARVRFWARFRAGYEARLTLSLSARLREALSGTGTGLPDFDSGKALVDFQRGAVGTAAQKDAVIGVLLRTQILFPKDAESAELLFCAMSPVLWDRFDERRGWAPRAFGEEEWFDELWMHILTAWTAVVRNYPITRRPARFAANLQGLLRHELHAIEKEKAAFNEAEAWIREHGASLASPLAPAPGEEAGPGIFELGGTEADAGPASDEELSDASARLRSAARGLDDVDCSVVVQSVLGQRRHKEIAKRLGITAVASRLRYSRSTATLRDLLDSRGPATRVVLREAVGVDTETPGPGILIVEGKVVETTSASGGADTKTPATGILIVEGEAAETTAGTRGADTKPSEIGILINEGGKVEAAEPMPETILAGPPTPGPSVTGVLRAHWQNVRTPGHFRTAMAGIKCPRALYFRAEGTTESVVRERRTWFAQHLVDNALDSKAVCANERVEYARNDVRIRGAADLLLRDYEGKPALAARVHSVSIEEWEKVDEKPFEHHKAEANLLAVLLGAPTWSVCYVHGETGYTIEHVGAANRVAAEWSIDNILTVAQARRAGVPPKCPTELGTRKGAPCKCRWNKVAC